MPRKDSDCIDLEYYGTQVADLAREMEKRITEYEKEIAMMASRISSYEDALTGARAHNKELKEQIKLLEMELEGIKKKVNAEW